MDWAVYGALIAGFLAVIGAAAFLAVRVLQGWRDFKRLRRRLDRELDRLTELTEQTEKGAARAGDQARLTESLDRLRVALAQFAVLRSALDEAESSLGRFTAVYPRK